MGQELNGGAPAGVVDENMLGLANPMESIPIGREDLIGEDRPGAGLAESIRDFVAEGGRSRLKAVRDAAPLKAPPPSSLPPADNSKPVSGPRYADEPEDDARADRKA